MLLEAFNEQRDEMHEMHEMRNTICVLRDMISKQHGAIQELHRQLEDTKTQLSEELRQARDLIDVLQRKPIVTATAQASPSRSYAEIARTPPSSQPSGIRTLSSQNTTPSTLTDTLFCTIDTSRVDGKEKGKVQVADIRKTIEAEIQKRESKENWRCAAVVQTLDSGTLNLPGSVEKQVALDADHSAICKFDSNDSSTRQLVLGSIAAEVKRGLELAQENRSPDPLSFSERDNKCLEDLQVTNPREDKVRIELDKGGLLRDSYRWVLSNHEFRQWHDDRDGQLLWIRGDPGKGKTMLLCGIIDELKTTAPMANISFFFCQATDARINSATAALRGLIYMLVTQQPGLISHLRESYDGFGKQRFEGPNSWVALSKLFTSILEDPRSRSTYLVIDALNECTRDLDRLLGLVVQKSLAYPNVKWIVSSRNWPNIKELLDTATRKVELCLELNEESVSSAIGKYIGLKVDQLAQRKKYSDGTQDAVQRHLSSNAHGTFLWVALVCQELANISLGSR